jgi:hypothetical protein
MDRRADAVLVEFELLAASLNFAHNREDSGIIVKIPSVVRRNGWLAHVRVAGGWLLYVVMSCMLL